MGKIKKHFDGNQRSKRHANKVKNKVADYVAENSASTSADMVREDVPTNADPSSEFFPRKKRRLHTHERAKLMYEKIQAERKAEAEKRRLQKEGRKKALESYLSTKKKMNKALTKRNKRGQPNLNAQVEVLLEKIEKRMKKQ